ncbi:MAG: alginate lyase family protein [Tepidisphaeraceae bacterium]
MTKIVIAIIAGAAAALAGAAEGAFVHPGIFTSQQELERLQHRVAAADPDDATYAGYLSTMRTKFADVKFVPQPIARPKRLGKKELDPPVFQRDSAMTAYTLALKWAVTGDAAARDKAIQIMNAWADVFEQNEGDENRFLDSAWVVTVWCAAGELIRHADYHGQHADWPTERVQKFQAMIRHLEAESSQIIVRPFNPVSNWGTSAMLGDMAAGVFLDDPALYDRGRDALLKYMPDIIKPQGYCNEIFRDPWHGIVALSGTIQAAEVGRHQNDLSIYHARYEGQADPRLLIALRWYADPLRGKPVPVPPMGGPRGKTQPWAFIANHSSRNTGGFEMALNFYEWIEPAQDLDGFRDAVLRTYRPSGQDNSLFIESDTLTHANLNKPPVP